MRRYIIKKETWVQLKHIHEGQFEVSNMGNVRNVLTGNILTGDINSSGYRRVGMYSGGKPIRKFVHRLVAYAFIPNPKNKPVVNHKNGIKTDNTLENLEWCTRSQNDLHAFRTGLNKVHNLRPFKVEFKNGTVKKYTKLRELAIELGVSNTTVRMWLIKERYTYYKHNIKDIKYI